MTKITIIEDSISKGITHKVGNWYQHIGTGDLYLLARIGSKAVVLISPRNGNRWVEYAYVKDEYYIAEEEMRVICGGDKFTLIESITITKTDHE